MPRYFFHRTDGYVDHDTEGVELSGPREARVQAVFVAGACLQEDPAKVWAGQDFRIEVTDKDGVLLFTVVTLAIDAPSTIKRLKTEDDGAA